LVLTIAEHYTYSYVVTDSLGNTWNALTPAGGGPQSVIYYSFTNASGGALATGTDYVTVTGYYANFSFTAWSGTATTSVFDSQNGNTASASTIQTGSVTPSYAGSLIIAVVGQDSAVAQSIDSGFTVMDNLGPNPWGEATAYIIETSIVAKNPTWTMNGPSSLSANIAVFKPAGVAAAFAANPTVIVVGP
jgi:hypothetical protein